MLDVDKKEERCRVNFVFKGVFHSASHQLSVSLNLFVFHTRLSTDNHSNQIKKIPKDPALGWGSAPSLSLLGWLPAECNKGLCYAALLQTSVAKAQWQGALKCGNTCSRIYFISCIDSLLILETNKQRTWQKNVSDQISSGSLWLLKWLKSKKNITAWFPVAYLQWYNKDEDSNVFSFCFTESVCPSAQG